MAQYVVVWLCGLSICWGFGAAAGCSGFSEVFPDAGRSLATLHRAGTVMGPNLCQPRCNAGAGARYGPKKDKMCEKVIATGRYDDYYMGFNRRIE